MSSEVVAPEQKEIPDAILKTPWRNEYREEYGIKGPTPFYLLQKERGLSTEEKSKSRPGPTAAWKKVGATSRALKQAVASKAISARTGQKWRKLVEGRAQDKEQAIAQTRSRLCTLFNVAPKAVRHRTSGPIYNMCPILSTQMAARNLVSRCMLRAQLEHRASSGRQRRRHLQQPPPYLPQHSPHRPVHRKSQEAHRTVKAEGHLVPRAHLRVLRRRVLRPMGPRGRGGAHGASESTGVGRSSTSSQEHVDGLTRRGAREPAASGDGLVP